ncbi:hypothetical protein AB0K51_05010 [Kitasatospora sp. NPDC049285]|uniref:hypothetical protein n=1 Tax=Kitasatospora sp. NPDC049285 TaxID=3157096 RepID=UPI00342F9082
MAKVAETAGIETLQLAYEPWRRYGSGVVLAVLALAVTVSTGLWPVVVLGVLAGGWLGVRAVRQAVLCGPDGVLVRGLLWSRRIALADLAGHGFGTVLRFDRGGRLRSTPLWAFRLPPRTARGQRVAFDCLHALARWTDHALAREVPLRGRRLRELDDAALRRELRLAGSGPGPLWERHRRQVDREVARRELAGSTPANGSTPAVGPDPANGPDPR